MARSRANVFSLSFLDVMFCGFGAVVLFFMIINHSTAIRTKEDKPDKFGEVLLLEEEVVLGERNLVRIKERLAKISNDEEVAVAMTNRLVQELAQNRDKLADQTKTTLARKESMEKLKTDLKSVEDETRRLEGAAADDTNTGNTVRAFLGAGDRQYLTGMRVGGERILILLDGSASMLGETIVNVIRRRNLPDEQKIRAAKWQRALATIDWLSAQIPPDSSYQIVVFNTEAKPLISGTEGQWLSAHDTDELNRAIELMTTIVPQDGTSLYNALDVVNSLDPYPDNVFLLTDGLPTQGKNRPLTRDTVTERTRLRHFRAAVRQLPRGIPINVILFPMEGDPKASGSYWNFAQASGGTLLSPARDWP